MSDNQRIKELEAKVAKELPKDIEGKYWDNFTKFSTYMGEGVYQWKGILASDTRVLFLKGILRCEGVTIEDY